MQALRPRSMAVVWDVMLDRYVRGRVDRLSPEAPVQVLEAAAEDQMPGGAADVAMKAVGLASRVRLVGLVGDDEPAAPLRGLQADGRRVDDGLVAAPARATTVKTRFIAHDPQLIRIDREKRDAPAGATRDQLIHICMSLPPAPMPVLVPWELREPRRCEGLRVGTLIGQVKEPTHY